MNDAPTYRTFLRSCTCFEEYSAAEKIEQDTGLTWAEARAACTEWNAARAPDEVASGTKLEFEEE